MPELAEVFYFSRQWRPGLGRTILRVSLHGEKRVFRGSSPRALRKGLSGRRLTSIRTHGKQMLFRFGRDCWLGVHLGMTGTLLTESSRHQPLDHDHLVLYTRERALIFRDPRLFGRIRFTRSSRPPSWWSELPPGPLSPAFSFIRLKSFLQRRGGTPLKPLLLLQEFFPGIGNWMADEILWRARLHPLTPAAAVPDRILRTLHNMVRKVSLAALRTIGRNGQDPPATWLFPHRWQDGGKCPRCRGALIRRPVAGRTACWCARCQKPALPRRPRRS